MRIAGEAIRLALAVPVLCISAAWGMAAASEAPQPVRGSRLSLRLEAAGGRMVVSAGHFWELPGETDPALGKVRRFVPGEVKIRVEGKQSSEYRLLPLGGETWHERTMAELSLDQGSDWRLPPETLSKHEREWWSGVPVRIEIRQNSSGTWELFLATRDPALPGGVGELRRHETRSVWTEKVQRFPLEQGQRTSGEPKARTQPREILLDLQIGQTQGATARSHSNLLPPALAFHRAEGLPVTVEGPGKLRSVGEMEEISVARLEPGTEGGFGGCTVKFAWDFRLGEPPDVGWWEAEAGLEKWLPSYGGQLRFCVRLSQKEGVEGLRFVLRETSRHPGVAINAGLEHLAGDSPRGVAGKCEVALELKQEQTVLAWKRHYPAFQGSADDTSPDLYFEETRNPGGLVEGEAHLGGATGGKRGTELRFEKLAAEMTGVLTVADWAASGRLAVQVRLDGMWEDLAAKGAGLEQGGLSLRFPVDANGDGVPDAIAGPPSGVDDGDGLDWQEEYRGVLMGGRHVRLDPGKRDVFLIDYEGALREEAKRGVVETLRRNGLEAHWLGLAEHRNERVGKAGSVVVVEKLETSVLSLILRESDSLAQSRAWKAIRPRPGVGTVFVDEGTGAQWIAGDVKRALAGKGGAQ